MLQEYVHNCIELGTRSHAFMSLGGLSSHTTAFAAASVPVRAGNMDKAGSTGRDISSTIERVSPWMGSFPLHKGTISQKRSLPRKKFYFLNVNTQDLDQIRVLVC